MYETQNAHKTKRLAALAPRKLYFQTIKENGANKDCHLLAIFAQTLFFSGFSLLKFFVTLKPKCVITL